MAAAPDHPAAGSSGRRPSGSPGPRRGLAGCQGRCLGSGWTSSTSTAASSPLPRRCSRAARAVPAGPTVKLAGSARMVMSAIRVTAIGRHIAAGRGRAGGWRVTGPARRALTGWRPLPGRGPPAGPRDLRCRRTAARPGAAAPGRGLGGEAGLIWSAIVRPSGDRDGRVGRPPRRAAGTRHAGLPARRYRRSRMEGKLI
jgi:hypothetical protein